MAFHCQRDSYATELLTEVVSCCPGQLKTEDGGKKQALSGYNVILKDTVLFPEGGGQPDDRGFIGEIPVLRVTRQGPDAVHFMTSPLEAGATVMTKLDWERRFDHMQQHSGQHLVTAIADSLYGFKTTSWELGRQRSFIELDTPTMTAEQVETIEKLSNEKIRHRVPVIVRLITVDDPEFETVRSRGLPDDHAGPVRIIDIEGVDANMCCGTHVANLSDLQVIKILGTEKGKKNKTNVLFLAGERVLKYAGRSYSTEKALTSLLKPVTSGHQVILMSSVSISPPPGYYQGIIYREVLACNCAYHVSGICGDFPSGSKMAFHCQRDSYATELLTEVVSCCPGQLKTEDGGKKQALSGYNVILKDTVLFPEGGGQPDDRGFIGEIPVLRVTRQGPDAVHFMTSPLEAGATVMTKLDWERRFDHMQQHSGQHLITAIADSLYGFKTTSWELGRQRSFIELDTPTMTAEQVETIEKLSNEKIRHRVPVIVRLITVDDPEFETVRSRGLPDDHAGPVRIIDIEGVDANMCCGTHVANLSDLQVIKILGTEKGKKNKTNVLFLAGERVLKYAGRSYSTEKALTSLLKNGPEEHVEAVDKLQKSVRLLQKSNVTLLRDLAVLTAQSYKNRADREKLFSLHRKDGDNEFMNIIANEIGTDDTLVFLTVGDEKASGLFLLAGPVEVVEKLGPRVSQMLDGKGAGKQGRFQGKANKMSQRGEAEALLRQVANGTGASEGRETN